MVILQGKIIVSAETSNANAQTNINILDRGMCGDNNKHNDNNNDSNNNNNNNTHIHTYIIIQVVIVILYTYTLYIYIYNIIYIYIHIRAGLVVDVLPVCAKAALHLAVGYSISKYMIVYEVIV